MATTLAWVYRYFSYTGLALRCIEANFCNQIYVTVGVLAPMHSVLQLSDLNVILKNIPTCCEMLSKLHRLYGQLPDFFILRGDS